LPDDLDESTVKPNDGIADARQSLLKKQALEPKYTDFLFTVDKNWL